MFSAAMFSDSIRHWLESAVLPAYLPQARWFGGKARTIAGIALTDTIAITDDSALALVEVRFTSGDPEQYQLALQCISPASAAPQLAESPAARIAERGDEVLLDALFAPDFRAGLWQRLTDHAEPAPDSRVLSVEQSNSSLLYGERAFVKVFRRIQPGLNPDAEILRFLTEQRHFPHVPAFLGALEHPLAGGEPALLAIATAAVPNRGDAWTFTLGELRDFYTRADSEPPRDAAQVRAVAGPFLDRIAQLGTRTGELHVALGAATTLPDFAPEPLTAADFSALGDTILDLWREVLATAPREHEPTLAAFTARIAERARALSTHPIAAAKCRTHGDYHLGQVLETGGDFVILDFEGEPARSLAERRRKSSPARDVAGMVRSLHYAAHAARPVESERALPWAEAWTAQAERTFLDAWRRATRGTTFRPATDAGLDALLRAHLLEKAIYEVRYELNNRPTWLHIPLRGLARVLGE
jgi:trehalose synthase-fused probable maltokinase